MTTAAMVLGVAVLVVPALVGWLGLRSRGMDRCFVGYLRDRSRRVAPPPGRPTHVLLCVADHFEPKRAGVPAEVADRRVAAWAEAYPRLLGQFRDRDGRPPQHTFFYPAEEYEPRLLDDLAALCRAGFGEVEVHLHHHDDTSANVRRTLVEFRDILAERHGLLGRDRATGRVVYGFIHGNWALDHGHPAGKFCGVVDELDVLRETGCYADLTMPAAPDPCQVRTINRIYYAVDDPARARSHDRGVEVGAAPRPDRGLMLIQGPLLLDWAGWPGRPLPRLENGCLQGNQPPTMARLDAWVRAGVRVAARPDWSFVKVYTHGAEERNSAVLLGPAMVAFHRALADRMAADLNFHVHYVTARELYNLARAAEAGYTGSVAGARDFEILPPGRPAPTTGFPAAGPRDVDLGPHERPPERPGTGQIDGRG